CRYQFPARRRQRQRRSSRPDGISCPPPRRAVTPPPPTGGGGWGEGAWAGKGRPLIIMPTETLHFENARVAQQLFDNNTQNLRALEENLGVKATAREGWIKLEGPEEGIERARQMFQVL